MGLAAVGFMACSSNDDLTTEEARTSGGDAYASFTIDLGSPYLHTRSGQKGDELGVLKPGDEHYGTEGEQEVKRVRAVMYDESNTVVHAIDYDIKGDGKTPVTGNDAVSPSFPDKYRFVTFANKVK